MAQLAEAYIHFRPYDAPERELRLLGKYAERLGIEIAGEVYGGDVVVHVELEEGSLKTRIAIAGAIAWGVYNGVANYKGFKESVVEMCKDAREFSVDVCKPFSEKANVPLQDVYRFERRLKTPGKLYRIASRLEKLEGSVSDLSNKDVQRELGNLRAQLAAVAEDLSEKELKEVERALRRPKLPPPREWPEPPPPRVIIRREDDEELPFPFLRAVDEPILPTRRIVFQSTNEVPRQRRLRFRRQSDGEQSLLED